MALSSNSLVHLTNFKQSLIGILNESFKVKYCLENVITQVGVLKYAIPMVSFCDIPLSELKDHITKCQR
ncbi:abortive phage resistance protein AbiGi (putative antitoxin) [Mucilaginibacter oryzae]|uniref:Abortive phage resistance protein AbiGi (Putative antitoxin) n=1 Tax=Mucilaginibacter oryzae TaxID=468058 RepID=A0A316HQ36_9SPHI|nr:abortive phage resistance protein AbiGi (putative antitoxin) [Mucilaginibacter oryzae]